MHDALVFPEWLTKARTIAVIGNGREGKSTIAFLHKYFPHTKTIVYEQHQDHFEIPAVDVAFKSPGIPKRILTLDPSTYLTSQTDLFVEMFGAQTIAITGTKGKSTTAHVIHHVLSVLGHSSILIGNIGRPALQYIEHMTPEMTAVFEMSAFQTETIHHAVHTAVFTSLYQDHLDYYDSMDEYAKAKQHLFLLQGPEDLCLYRSDYPAIILLLDACTAEKIPYTPDTREYPVNAIPAVLIAERLGASTQQIHAAMASVTDLPGRRENLGTFREITFFDDALATIPEATILAIKSTEHLTTLIVGGHDRHQDFSALAEVIAASSIKNLILFPVTGSEIGELVSKLNPSIQLFPVESMQQAIEITYAKTGAGNSVLLSTASPSFGLFRDYADRSQQFKHWIHTLA